MVDNAKNHALIATKLAELGHPGAQVKIVQAERPEAYAAPQEPVQDDTPPVPVAATPVASTVQQTTAPVAKTAPASRPAQTAQVDPNEFKNDPLIKKALEIFKGEIKSVTT